MIPDRLDGTRIAITGGTGFLGTALIERLLRCVPGCQLVLLIRPGRRSTVEQRAKREIFSNNAFDRLREELGKDGFAAMVAERVTPIAGDVGTDGLALDDDGRDALAACTVLIHSAATVSFDSPLDAAVEVNLLGPTRIVQTLHALGVTPHLVSVSTCYVAGNRRGAAPEIPVHESPFFIDVDWRGEVDGARRARTDAEADSRRPDALARFRKEARHEIGAAGVPALAGKTEQRRSAWVKEQMVEAGRARAASLGWPDAYAYTKALGERALLQNRGDVPVSIVRPSIIESSLHEPFPGWIRGFRMAEPVIISYARGLLKEFPGVPEGTIDVIPVDLVVAAIIDAAAGPVPDEPTITQVASGSVNPLRYRHLVDMVSTFFTDHPIYDVEGQPILVPDWSFPGRGRVQRQLERGQGRHRPAASGRCRRCRSAASRPRGPPPSRASGRRSSERSPTSSSTAPTPSARRSTGSTASSPVGSSSRPRTRPRSASTPASSTGTTTPPRSTCRRWSSTPGCVRRRADGSGRSARTGSAARSSTPPATSPPSTSRTR